MTLPTVCRRCDGPCQCDEGLLENEAMRWLTEETPRRPLCQPNQFQPLGMLCRVETARDYSDREMAAHVKACGKPCKGDFWLLHTYPYKNRVDPLDEGYSRHQIDWDDARMIEAAGGDAP